MSADKAITVPLQEECQVFVGGTEQGGQAQYCANAICEFTRGKPCGGKPHARFGLWGKADVPKAPRLYSNRTVGCDRCNRDTGRYAYAGS